MKRNHLKRQLVVCGNGCLFELQQIAEILPETSRTAKPTAFLTPRHFVFKLAMVLEICSTSITGARFLQSAVCTGFALHNLCMY